MNNMRKLLNLVESAISPAATGISAGELEENSNDYEVTDKDVQDAYTARRIAFANDAPDRYALADYASMLANKRARQQSMKHNGHGFDPITGAAIPEEAGSGVPQHSAGAFPTVAAATAAYKAGQITYQEFMDYLSSGPAEPDPATSAADEYADWTMQQGELGKHARGLGESPSQEEFSDTVAQVEAELKKIIAAGTPAAAAFSKVYGMKDTHQWAMAVDQVMKSRLGSAMSEDLNNGYDSVLVADGQDFFPNGADTSVVDAVGPSGAKQGDNPGQKKMQVANEHTELVYAYRKYLKENASPKKKITESKQAVSNFAVHKHALDFTYNSATEEANIEGQIAVSATVPGLDGQPKKLSWVVWVDARCGVSWTTEDSIDQWQHEPSYSEVTFAELGDTEISAVNFDDGSEINIDGTDVAITDSTRYVDPAILRSLLDVSLYSGIVSKFADSEVSALGS